MKSTLYDRAMEPGETPRAPRRLSTSRSRPRTQGARRRAARALPLLAAAGALGGLALLGPLARRVRRAPPPPPPRAAAFPDEPSLLPETAGLMEALEQQTERIRLALFDASSAAGAGLVHDAIRILFRQLDATPNALEIQGALAGYLAADGRTDEAYAWAMKVLEAVPGSLEARQLLAHILLARAEPEAAYEAALWVLNRAPQNEEALETAARASLGAERPDRALTHVRALLRARPNDPQVRQMAGVVHLRMNNFARASHQFTELIRANPADPLNHLNLAICHAQQAHEEEAVNVLSRALHAVGVERVAPWLGNEGFDPIRNSPAFVAFRQEISRRQGAMAVSRTEEQPEPSRGILPSPPIPLRPIQLK